MQIVHFHALYCTGFEAFVQHGCRKHRTGCGRGVAYHSSKLHGLLAPCCRRTDEWGRGYKLSEAKPAVAGRSYA